MAADDQPEEFTRLVESTRLPGSAERLADAIERDQLGWERVEHCLLYTSDAADE